MVSPQRTYSEVLSAIQELESAPFRIKTVATVPNTDRAYPILSVLVPAATPTPRAAIYLSGGIHGDEPAGVWAAIEWLRRIAARPPQPDFSFLVLPCINPYGYEHNQRVNGSGIDLNRQFRTGEPPAEVRAVRRATDGRRFQLAMEFHEDIDSPGVYLYELARPDEPSWGDHLLARIRSVSPVNDADEIEGLPARGGLISRASMPLPIDHVMRDRTDWPQAFYHYQNGTGHCFTTETPIHLPLADRVQVHLTALETALDCLRDQLETRQTTSHSPLF